MWRSEVDGFSLGVAPGRYMYGMRYISLSRLLLGALLRRRPNDLFPSIRWCRSPE